MIPLRILSWNIYMLPVLSWFNGALKRAELMGEVLASSSNYDILVFQEAFSSKCRKILLNKLGSHFPYTYGPFNGSFKFLKTNSGLWILSKLPLRHLKTIEFHDSRGLDMVAQKGAVLFAGEYEGVSFHLLATHLQSSFHSQDIREKQYRDIHALFSEYSSTSLPQILCGDFNTEKRDLERYRSMLDALDAKDTGFSGKLQVTYDEVHNPLAMRNNGMPEVLDYVLIRNSSRIKRIETEVVEYLALESGDKVYLSDHNALKCEIEFEI